MPSVAELAGVLGALGAVLVLLPRGRLALLAGLALVAAAEAMLGAFLLRGEGISPTPARLGLVLAGAAVILAGAFVFSRFPAVVPVALLLAAPFRLPLGFGGQERFLLLPLYVALASAVLALAYRTARRDDVPAAPRLLAIPAALFVALAATSLVWSHDVRAGAIKLAFVLLPFTLLLAVLARAPYRSWLPRALAAALASLAGAFALLGLSQLWTKNLFFAPDVEAANADERFFRVTAVFNDPSIYGRYLAITIVVLLVALWLRRLALPLGLGLIVLLSAGLYFSYSQSSLTALFVGILATTVAAADAASRRIVIAASVVLALVGAVLVLAVAHGDSLRRATSGRSDLVVNTAEVVRDHPLVGVGLGAERRASREHAREDGNRLGKASHTTVLTVAAELGAIGLAAFVVFLLGALALFASAYARDEALGLGLGGAFLVVLVHSIFYSGFFEDPVVWGTMGVAAAAMAARRPLVRLAPGTLAPTPLPHQAVAPASRSPTR